MNSGQPDTHKRKSAPEVAEEIRRRLHAGVYLPGHRLREISLAEELDTGRSHVREAFRLLVGEGYLSFEANRGALVRVYSRDEVLAVGRVREVLEGLTARMCAERQLAPAERARLQTVMTRLDQFESAGELESFALENRNFHNVIAELSGNELALKQIQQATLPLIRVQLPIAFSIESLARSNADHRVIFAAIMGGAPEAAEAAMRQHVRQGNAHVSALDAADFS